MIIVALRTDAPDAELHVISDDKRLDETWYAHRELSSTLLTHISNLLAKVPAQVADVKGIVIYQGPGSFTGLRIGFSVANALGASLNIPVVATGGDDWLERGRAALQSTSTFVPVEPFYGSDAHITPQKK